MSRSYLAVLAAVAVLILAGGLVVRRSLSHADALPATAPPSEAAALQRLSQEGDLRSIAEFVDERVRGSASRVEFVSETQSAGLRWATDTVLATRDDQPIVAVRRPVGEILRPAPTGADQDTTPRATATRARHRWVIVVGRRADGGVVSTAALAGGSASVRCGERTVDALVIGTSLDERFAGAGLFALDGRLLGMAVRCAGRVVGVPTAEIARLLAESSTITERVRRDFGFATTPLDAQGRAVFGVDAGLLVTEVDQSRLGSTLRAGDVLVAVDSARVTTTDDLRRFASAADSITVTRRRGTAVSTVRLGRQASAVAASNDPATALGLVLDMARDSAMIVALRPASPAAVAGLRPGDRLVRIDGEPVRSAADARRRLSASRTGSVFLVIVRGAVEHGVVVSLGSRTAPR